MFAKWWVQYYTMYNVHSAQAGDFPMFRRFYVQKVLCSENICSKGPIFTRSYVQKVLCSENICSKGPIFRRFYVQKVLYSDIFRRSYIQKILCLMYEKTYIFQFQQYNKSQPLISAHSVKGQMSFCHGALSVVCQSTIAKIAIGTLINTKPGVITEG